MSSPTNIDMSAIVGRPVAEVSPFPDIHSGQASDVWLVRTEDGEQVIVRSSRMQSLPDMDFWVGCKALYGIDPSNTDLPYIHRVLRPMSRIAIPRIVRSVQSQNRWFHVVGRLPGAVVTQFADLPAEALHNLGASTATIHQHTKSTFGRLDDQASLPASDWTDRLIQTMQLLVERYYVGDPKIAGHLEEMCRLARRLPTVTAFAPIMLDFDPTQFLSDGQRLTGLVDVEVYAYGPPEFELCMLEYLLDGAHAQAFRAGYETVAALPPISQWRPLYRYLGLLLAVQGRVPYQPWMEQIERF